MNKKMGWFLWVGVVILFAGSSIAGDYPKTAKQATIKISFADSIWNGKEVPKGAQCRRFGGTKFLSPRIKVEDIPAGTNVVVVEFSDRSYQPMDRGGHGELALKIGGGAKNVIVPEVLGHQYKLPRGMFLIREHQAPSWDTAGAYMPPCSGGNGNEYYVTVRAMAWDFANPKKSRQLAWAVLEIGVY